MLRIGGEEFAGRACHAFVSAGRRHGGEVAPPAPRGQPRGSSEGGAPLTPGQPQPRSLLNDASTQLVSAAKGRKHIQIIWGGGVRAL